MRRRAFLQSTVGLVATTGWLQRPVGAAGIADRYAKLTPGKYLGELKVLCEVDDPKGFAEGPCCDRAGTVYFTNTHAERIMRWDGKELSVFREDSGAANGLLFDRNGRLVACEGVAGRVTRTDMVTGRIEVLCDAFNGFPLGLPNDLTFDAAGRIYFTSRLPNTDPTKGNVNSVYRIDADGRTTRVLHWPDIHMPNGLVIAPDDRTFYLIESAPNENQNRCIVAYDLADGELSNRRVLIDFYPGRGGDGMAVDAEGNLYVAAGLHATRKTSETLDTRPGIHVVSPRGELLDYLETPEDTVTNCRFGGADLKTLYITGKRKLLSARTQIAGAAMYRPEK